MHNILEHMYSTFSHNRLHSLRKILCLQCKSAFYNNAIAEYCIILHILLWSNVQLNYFNAGLPVRMHNINILFSDSEIFCQQVKYNLV